MKKNKIVAIAFIAIAVVSLAFSIACFALDGGNMYGGTASDGRYGADFYTDVQNAAAQAATNTYYIGQCIEEFSKCMLLISAFAFMIVALICATVGVSKLFETETVSVGTSTDEAFNDLPEL